MSADVEDGGELPDSLAEAARDNPDGAREVLAAFEANDLPMADRLREALADAEDGGSA